MRKDSVNDKFLAFFEAVESVYKPSAVKAAPKAKATRDRSPSCPRTPVAQLDENIPLSPVSPDLFD